MRTGDAAAIAGLPLGGLAFSLDMVQARLDRCLTTKRSREKRGHRYADRVQTAAFIQFRDRQYVNYRDHSHPRRLNSGLLEIAFL